MKKISFFCLFLILFLTPKGWGVVYFWQKQPQNERLVFEFTQPIPSFKVVRTNYQELTIYLPSTLLSKEPPASPVSLAFSRLIKEVILQKENILIITKTNSFGYIFFWQEKEKKLYVDIFYDPLGKKWNPPQKSKQITPKKELKKVKKIPSPKQQPKPKPKVKSSAEKKEPPSKPVQPTNTSSSEQPPSSPLSTAKAVPETKTIPTTPTPQTPLPKTTPLYKIKAPIKRVSIEQAEILRPSNLSQKTAPPATYPTNTNASASKETTNLPPKNATSTTNSPQNNTSLASPEKSTPPTEQEASSNATQPDFEALLVTTKAAIVNGELDAAIDSLEGMLKNPLLPDKLKEEIYYLYADVLFDKYKDKLPEGFAKLISAYERAINYNPKSLRVPSALLNLGYINLKLKNIPEARGYFNLLREKYPYDPNIPLTYYYWGEFYFNNQQYQKAADELQYVLTKFPDHKVAEDAAILLAKSLTKLEYYKQGLEIIKYIEQRWPRYYLKRTDTLMQAAYLYYKNKYFKEAKKRYLLYYNLLPKGKEADIALARIGDIFLLENKTQAAKKFYEQAATQFPEKEGGLIASMRLAEEGIYDKPSLKDMFSVFNRPFNLRPQQIYTTIIEKYPESPLANIAKVKLAMWELFNKRPENSLDILKKFFTKLDPNLKEKALEVGKEAFSAILSKYTQGNNPSKALFFISKYPFLEQVIPLLAPKQKLLLISAFIQDNQIDQALKLLKPLLRQDPKLEHTRDALALALTLYLKLEDWDKVIELGQKAKKWPLSESQKQKVLFSLALAYQKKNNFAQSIPLWRQLASDIKLDIDKRAYALYFLAKHYAQEKQWENVYIFAQEALSLFLKNTSKEKEKIIDCLKMLIVTTKLTGREMEALSWALELKKYIPESSPSWPSFQYQLADLYQLNGNQKAWQETLKELIAKKRNSLYAELAQRDLALYNLKQKASVFAPKK